MNRLRILSLLPAATEMVYLLGLEKYLVGVSHECDYPPQVKLKPKVTSSVVSNSMNSRAIDNQVKLSLHRGPGVFHIREGVLKKLKPNLILTQELCKVCAVGFDQVHQAAKVLNGEVKIISLEPESVDDIFDNILLIGESSGKSLESRNKVKKLRQRLRILNSRLSILVTKKPRALVIEWLDPIMVAGHWVPQMVEMAGGKNLLTKKGEKSKIVTIDQILAAKPDILIISPCGFDIQRSIKEIARIQTMVDRLQSVKTYLVDGNSYMTRPGPRIVSGIEILSEILHPELFFRKYNKKDWIELR